jgi:hypothetical protein
MVYANSCCVPLRMDLDPFSQHAKWIEPMMEHFGILFCKCFVAHHAELVVGN